MTDAKTIITVTQAYLDGKNIQVRSRVEHALWRDCKRGYEAPTWNWQDYEYRVKPEPREVWVNVYPYGYGCGAYMTPKEADSYASSNRTACVKFREVLD